MEKNLKDIELFLFDMDGTLYLGDNVYEGAIELMNDLPKLGKKYIYLTNNSSRAGTDYITRLRRLGFPCEAENVFTSGMATGMYLNQRHPGAKVQEMLTDAFLEDVQAKGTYLRSQIEALDLPCFGATRGMGLMIGIQVKDGWTNKEIASKLIENGLLVLTAGPGMRLLPPLVISQEEMDQGLEILKKTLS